MGSVGTCDLGGGEEGEKEEGEWVVLLREWG